MRWSHAGIIGAGLAAVTGLADWTGIPSGTRAKRAGLLHDALNAAVLGLFAIAWLIRAETTTTPPARSRSRSRSSPSRSRPPPGSAANSSTGSASA
jgi:hypothetical protein